VNYIEHLARFFPDSRGSPRRSSYNLTVKVIRSK